MRLPNYIQDLTEWRSSFKFSTSVEIRFSETDMFGHMNNVSPFIYFEEARIKFFDKIDLFGNLAEAQAKVPVVGDLQCDYIKQVFFGDTLSIYVKVAEIGNSSIDIHYMGINQNNDLCLTARGKVIQINPKTGKPVPINDQQREKLNLYSESVNM
ncbi:acyl-CoA thioesterase [Piscibacillus halophilus]|uniref:Acyl-CoA thioester hydrolase n=1 Tax=Piscibacillus halophilus TaxID=571933 RepID=A0A1H9J837_9BACI|nr:thioesterase family protein [Piscibacillus halophilus]SEQ82958.1 acyl-CoA thioester hydrolase [Piscibacillus halophilus]